MHRKIEIITRKIKYFHFQHSKRTKRTRRIKSCSIGESLPLTNQNRLSFFQNWKTAGAIKIELIRPAVWNSEGKKNKNTTLIDSYQYSIADIKIGGNCQCNGHADR